MICLVSYTGSLGTAGQLNYSSTKAAMSVMPKVITAEFFRRGLADKIRCVAVAPGYVDTAMVIRMSTRYSFSPSFQRVSQTLSILLSDGHCIKNCVVSFLDLKVRLL